MGNLKFQVTGLRVSKQSKKRRSQKRSSFIMGALLATVILSLTRPSAAPAPALIVSNVPAFGNQSLEVPPTTKPLLIQNTGAEALQLSSISTLTSEGNASSDFVVLPGSCVQSKIEQGASCKIDIEFSPKGTGLRQSKLVFTDNAPGSPQTFSLAGSGFLPPHPDARADPTPVDFGRVGVEGTTDKSLTITNDGADPLVIEGIQFDGESGPFTISQQSCEHATLQANENCQMTISFSPKQSGIYSRSISIPHGDIYPLAVPIVGVAIGPQVGYCCVGGKIAVSDEATCKARDGIFSENPEDLKNRCQKPQRQLPAPVPIKPGSASVKQPGILYPCDNVQFSWNPVDDPGETVSYTVSLYAYSAIGALAGQNPWLPFNGLTSTPEPKLVVPIQPAPVNPKATILSGTKSGLENTVPNPFGKSMAAKASKVQPQLSRFYWQVVARDSSGNVSGPSEPRYFVCRGVPQ
jgi:HYDIN/CFA65/VesB-like, Ig-like domain